MYIILYYIIICYIIKISLKDDDSVIEFISYEKLKEVTTEEIKGEKGLKWGREKGGEEEWKVNEESIITSFSPLSLSDFSFSDVNRIKIENGIIKKSGKEFSYESFIINKELKKVFIY